MECVRTEKFVKESSLSAMSPVKEVRPVSQIVPPTVPLIRISLLSVYWQCLQDCLSCPR